MVALAAGVCAETYVVRVNQANLRHGPGEEFPVLWQVEKGYVFEEIAKKGHWLQVRDIEGDTGWILDSLVRRKPVVVVLPELVNIREKPGTGNPILFRAERGVVLNYLGKQKNWVQVNHSGEGTGWIREDLVWGNP